MGFKTLEPKPAEESKAFIRIPGEEANGNHIMEMNMTAIRQVSLKHLTKVRVEVDTDAGIVKITKDLEGRYRISGQNISCKELRDMLFVPGKSIRIFMKDFDEKTKEWITFDISECMQGVHKKKGGTQKNG